VIRLTFASRLEAPAAEVWAHASSMGGVNAELMPFMRMSVPAHVVDLEIEQAPVGRTAFASWLLAFGFLPVDRHFLGFERILPGVGFDERSWSWMQKQWIHRRRVEPDGEGSLLTDQLEFEPRLPFAGLLLEPIVRALFTHRHQRLRERFGERR
jgi:ligand-binding SRPBCC domain-containing protein